MNSTRITRCLLSLPLGLLALAPLAAHPAAAASSPVVGTYSVADNGQGCWGGGALLADGSVTGNAACSFANGQVIARLSPTGWTFSDSSDSVVVLTFSVRMIKGPNVFGGSSLTFPVPVGGPLKVTDSEGGTTILRVTINQ